MRRALHHADCPGPPQLSTVDGIERALPLFLVVSRRIARLMRLGRTVPDLDAGLLLEPEEWQAATSA